jgi:putative phage-type endonuclease
MNPYRSPQELWEEKLGMRERDPELENDPNIERGVFLEPSLIRWTGKRVGYPVEPNNETFVSRHHQLVIATPDGFAYPSNQDAPDRQVVEVKAPSPRTYEDWADPEEVEDGIPDYYIPQVQWEMAATDTESALISTLIGGNLRVYRMQRLQPLIDTLTRKAEAFWEHVIHNDPPPLDFAKKIQRDWLKNHLKSQASQDMREYGPLEAEHVEKEIEKFLDLKEKAEKAQEELEQVKSFLTFFVGDSAGFTTPSFKVTWKQSKASWKTDWKRYHATIRAAFPQHADTFDRVLKDCDYSADGSRRFLVGRVKEGNNGSKSGGKGSPEE